MGVELKLRVYGGRYMATKKTMTFNPTLAKEKMLKAYMRRQVSGMGTYLNQRAYALGIEPRQMYNLINESFASPRGGKREDGPLGIIDEDMEFKHKNSAVYNYFDLDTLISYGRFLQKVVETIEKTSYGRFRNRITTREFTDAINVSREWLVKNSGTELTHGYNPNRPIGYLKDENGRLAPEGTMSLKDFDKKYTEEACEKALEDYIEFGLEHGKIISFDGKRFAVNEKKTYRTYPEEYDVNFIRASGRAGEIWGYVDLDDRPYYGNVYTFDGDNYQFYDVAEGIEYKEKRNDTGKIKSFDKIYRRPTNVLPTASDVKNKKYTPRPSNVNTVNNANTTKPTDNSNNTYEVFEGEQLVFPGMGIDTGRDNR